MQRNSRQDAINRLREQQGRNQFFDSWEDDFHKTARRTVGGFIAVWATILIVNLILLGVGIWAIIELVQWVQTK